MVRKERTRWRGVLKVDVAVVETSGRLGDKYGALLSSSSK